MAYNRWGHRAPHSLPYMLFKQYNQELSDYIWANDAASKYVYTWLGKHGAAWGDQARKHFRFPAHVWNFNTLQDWADSYKQTQNWIYLNVVMSMSANLETFIDAIVAMAIESDPGVLLNASKSIDGTIMLKQNKHLRDTYKEHASTCTHGTWQARINAFKKIFGGCPPILESKHSMLESIRKMRNNVGHAFGRDIEDARNFERRTKLPQETISLQRVKNMLNSVFDVATGIDTYLMDNHIGEYQTILALHESWYAVNRFLSAKEKARVFMQVYNKDRMFNIGKDNCVRLIEYYQSI